MPSPAQPIERKLAAIFAADVAGYSRLMGQDEVGTLRRLSTQREIMDRLIGEHRGRIANTAGDSVLAEFPSVVDAVQCAVQVQEALAEANEGVPEDRRMSFRIDRPEHQRRRWFTLFRRKALGDLYQGRYH